MEGTAAAPATTTIKAAVDLEMKGGENLAMMVEGEVEGGGVGGGRGRGIKCQCPGLHVHQSLWHWQRGVDT